MSPNTGTGLQVGDEVEVEITTVAHGGVCVGRHEGQVLFVRWAIPGERVHVVVTDAPGHARFVRAEVIDVVQASVDRVSPPCAYASSCGGCDWQHVALDAQRRMKAAVVREQLTRLGGEEADRWADLQVEPVAGDDEGLGWRTRMRFAVDPDGRAGLHRYRSRDVVAIDTCLIAAPGIRGLDVTGRSWPGAESVLAVAPGTGPAIALADPQAGEARVRESLGDRSWRLDATAFWQVHPGAPQALVDAVDTMLGPRTGEHLWDLYAGVGLFSGALAAAISVSGRIQAVESDDVALRGARRSLHDLPQVHLHHDRVERWLARALSSGMACDVAIVDPPRAGAGPRVMRTLTTVTRRAIAYVACDPAALGRDVALARQQGWRLVALRAFDAFPMTHHVECVALLEPDVA